MRFVLRRNRTIEPSDQDAVAALTGVTVLDVSAKMFLVEGEESVLKTFVSSQTGWTLYPEVAYSLA